METDFYTDWLGVPPGARPPNHYALLGLPVGAGDAAAIEQAAYRQLDKLDKFALNPDPHKRERCQQMMNEVARARMTLADPALRADYDRGIGHAPTTSPRPAPKGVTSPVPVSPTAPAPTAPPVSTAAPIPRPAPAAPTSKLKSPPTIPSPAPRSTPPPTSPATQPNTDTIDATLAALAAMEQQASAPSPAASPARSRKERSDADEGPASGWLAAWRWPAMYAALAVLFFAIGWLSYRPAAPPTAPAPETVTPASTPPPSTDNRAEPTRSSRSPSTPVPAARPADPAPATPAASTVATTAQPTPTQPAPVSTEVAASLQTLSPATTYPPGHLFENSIGMKLAYIPAGEFMMGSPVSEAGRFPDETQHRVKISRAFLMGTTEVTQKQWTAVIGSNHSYTKGDDLPMEPVSWNDAVEFCRKLSQKEGKAYRLPTEAEWEYACRAGTTTIFSTGDTISTDEANYNVAAPDRYLYGNRIGAYRQKKMIAVGSLKANAWGLYDMHGNVDEFCADWYGEYPTEPATDPTGPTQGTRRVFRGGNWYRFALFTRSARRYQFEPTGRGAFVGFRVVCDLLGRSGLETTTGGDRPLVPDANASAPPTGKPVLSTPTTTQPSKIGDSITNTIGMTLVYIPPGSFRMGDPVNEYGDFDEAKQRLVRINKPFLMQTTGVTQKQWESLMETKSQSAKEDDVPVANVSWFNAMEFCRKLSRIEKKTYRLPTDAEWEYACRAGTTTPFNTGDTYCADETNHRYYDVGVYPRDRKLKRVGTLWPNTWGLYDMHSNGVEWCADGYIDFSPSMVVADLTDKVEGAGRSMRVVRKGYVGFESEGMNNSSASRWQFAPSNSYSYLGFRVVLVLSKISHQLPDNVTNDDRISVKLDMDDLLSKSISIDLDGVRGDGFISHFCRTTGVNVFVYDIISWPTTLAIDNIPARDVLNQVLKSVSRDASNPITWRVIDGVVVISTKSRLDRHHELLGRPSLSLPAIAETEANRGVIAKLKEPVSVDFKAQRLNAVVDQLRASSGLRFFTDRDELVKIGIKPDLSINLALNDTPIYMVLSLCLRQTSASFDEMNPVTWTVIDGVVVISTLKAISYQPQRLRDAMKAAGLNSGDVNRR